MSLNTVASSRCSSRESACPMDDKIIEYNEYEDINPFDQVVTMLQMMQNKIEADGC